MQQITNEVDSACEAATAEKTTEVKKENEHTDSTMEMEKVCSSFCSTRATCKWPKKVSSGTLGREEVSETTAKSEQHTLE